MCAEICKAKLVQFFRTDFCRQNDGILFCAEIFSTNLGWRRSRSTKNHRAVFCTGNSGSHLPEFFLYHWASVLSSWMPRYLQILFIWYSEHCYHTILCGISKGCYKKIKAFSSFAYFLINYSAACGVGCVILDLQLASDPPYTISRSLLPFNLYSALFRL